MSEVRRGEPLNCVRAVVVIPAELVGYISVIGKMRF